MLKQRITFQSGDLRLESVLYLPNGDGPFPCVVVCHPHPLYGGSMDNNVVDAVCNALVDASVAAFKFNFRGVGRSQGRYDDGRGEGEDAKSAIEYIATLQEIDAGRIGLCGYSAGAAFSLPACWNDERVKAIAAISPPLEMFDFTFLTDCEKPLLLASGSYDDFTPTDRFISFCSELDENSEQELVVGADHFWCGYEPKLAERVAFFFSKTFTT
ncbi:MAG: CocE/NonD family hydrolase [Dehalococcoidia bacterium]